MLLLSPFLFCTKKCFSSKFMMQETIFSPFSFSPSSRASNSSTQHISHYESFLFFFFANLRQWLFILYDERKRALKNAVLGNISSSPLLLASWSFALLCLWNCSSSWKFLKCPEKSRQLLTKANALAMVVSNIYRNNIMILDGGALIVRKFLLALHAIVYAFWFVFSQSPSFSARSPDRLIFFRLSKVHCYARPKPSRCNFHAIQIRRLVRKRDEAKAEKLRKVVATRFLFLLELFLGISSFRMFGFFLIPPKGIKSGQRRDL